MQENLQFDPIIVQTPEGTYRANHRHQVPLPITEHNSEANDPPDTQLEYVSQTRNGHIPCLNIE